MVTLININARFHYLIFYKSDLLFNIINFFFVFRFCFLPQTRSILTKNGSSSNNYNKKTSKYHNVRLSISMSVRQFVCLYCCMLAGHNIIKQTHTNTNYINLSISAGWADWLTVYP